MLNKLFFWKDKSLKKLLKNKNRESDFYFDDWEDNNILNKSSNFFRNVWSSVFFKEKNESLRAQIEDALLKLDFGSFLSKKLSDSIFGKLPSHDVNELIKQNLKEVYGYDNSELKIHRSKTNVFLIVGSNGSGKTTSVAKLAYRYKEGGFKVLIVAADTFRAGAVEQLESWSKTLEIDILAPSKHKEDPSALAYKALEKNKEEMYDLIIFDTSGKQHNNPNLLREMSKLEKTIKRFDESYPTETLLVVDATVGQTSFLQAKNFMDNVKLTGIILTKMDTLSKGGIIFAIKDQFKVPVKLIGTGESICDLRDFSLEKIVSFWFKDPIVAEDL